MDIITIADKANIDLDNMSLEELKKTVKYLYHKVQSLSADLDIERLKGRGIGYWGGIQPIPV